MKFQKRKLFLIPLALLVVIGIGCGIYLGDYYRADAEALSLTDGMAGDLVWAPEDATAGLIFYPGGKVDHAAYAPLMEALADRGILCVVTEMPFHLAVLDIDATAGIQSEYPNVERWYIGGHSLGGSMAAAYLDSCEEDYEGLILLAAYSTADLQESGLEVLSIYGSEDQVLDWENYGEYRQNLPEDFRELVIDGGCHAGFGMYGAQEGDGVPAITAEEQIAITAGAIAEMVGG